PEPIEMQMQRRDVAEADEVFGTRRPDRGIEVRDEPSCTRPAPRADDAGDGVVLVQRLQLAETALEAAGGEAAALEQPLGHPPFEAQAPELGDAAVETRRVHRPRGSADRQHVAALQRPWTPPVPGAHSSPREAPPSTASVTPVRKEARSEQRKATTAP